MHRTSSAPMRFGVVAWSERLPIHLSPRGQRTEHLINALKRYGEVERIGEKNIPQWLAGDGKRTTSSWYRRLARSLISHVLLDKYEITARQSLRRWCPKVDAAVLVGYPCSPLPFAAQRLVHHHIPYIVDIGDPWMLTNPYPEGGWLQRRRAARLERKLWASAQGVIVTTQGQGDALRRLFPHLRVLVRPNGYNSSEVKAISPGPSTKKSPSNELRLVHYGSLYGERVNFARIFQQLAGSGEWDKIILRQYGPDWEGSLESISANVEVDRRPPISWAEVLAEAHIFHAAVVIGWQNPAQMPSKAVQYLTLPIPRIAMVNSGREDALAAYVADKPGWAVVDEENGSVPEIVASHLSKRWGQVDLQVPESESWEAVEHVLGGFVVDVTAMQPVP
jgi:glycosyltransferase involved in cell wall biosynthesis